MNISVTGMACRLPGAESPEAFWELLCSDSDALGEPPEGRWGAVDVDPDGLTPGSVPSLRGGFLSGVDLFDHERFGIGEAEAAALDPQQRLLWTVAAEAIDDAALSSQDLRQGRAGAYVGIGYSEYETLAARSGAASAFSVMNAPNVTASRLSWAFDLRGPSIGIDAGCASALVALSYAARDLQQGLVDRAIVGAVSLLLLPDGSRALGAAGALSPAGRSRPFARDADGYVRGEGAVVLVLERSGRPARAVVASAAISGRGRGPGGLLAACRRGHREAIRAAADGHRIGLVEAHAVGAPADREEMLALAEVFSEGEHKRPVLVGSCKAKIGHLEWASGGAALIKAALCVERGLVPPQPPVDLPDDWPVSLALPRELLPLEGGALVNAFGLGGTDAAAVLRAAPRPPAPARGLRVAVASAPTRALAEEARTRWVRALAEGNAADLAATSASRERHAWVAAASGEPETLAASLAAAEIVCLPPAPRVALAFTGQGSQRRGMGLALYEDQPAFREGFDRCAAALDPLLPAPLLALLDSEDIDHTSIAQPALFALGIGLLSLVRSWGIVPTALLGHSLGEITASVAAGCLSVEEGARLVGLRARHMGALPSGGKMLAASVSEETAMEAIRATGVSAEVAAINGPESVVLSGSAEDITRLANTLEEEAFAIVRELSTSHAFHSRAMEAALAPFARDIRDIRARAPEVPLASNLTGLWQALPPDAAYWSAHLRGAVRFSDNVRAIDTRADLVIELGAAPILSGMARSCRTSARWLHLGDDPSQVAAAFASLVTAGLPVRGYAERARHVPAPKTPSAPRRHWLEAAPRAEAGSGGDIEALVERASALGFGRIDPDTPLRDQGFDSVTLAALAARLKAHGQAISLARVLTSPTLRAMLAPEPRAPAQGAIQAHDRPKRQVIAGFSVRLPGASSPSALWELMTSGRIATVPLERPSLRDAPPGSCGALLEDIDSFDPEAFGLTAQAAIAVDPAHRLLLEVAREALADAGLPADEVRGMRGGVYVALIAADAERGADGSDPAQEIGRLRAGASGQIARVLDWRGPALTVDTACSSSLVALHLAAAAIASGEIEIAIVAAAQLATSPAPWRYLAALGVLSPSGRCRPFDASADGYVRGEGAAAFVLASEAAAERLSLPIRARLLGSAVGSGRGGSYTTPSLDGQIDVIRSALERAGCAPSEIGYVEAHGTGTPLGDPIEGRALEEAYGQVAVGSIKSQIGHLEGASGAASLARVILTLQHGERTPQAGLSALSALWPAAVRPVTRREPHEGNAAVHAIGMTGTIAHAVLGPGSPGGREPLAVRWNRRPLLAAPDHKSAAEQALGRALDPERTLAEQGVDSIEAAALAARTGRTIAQIRRSRPGDLLPALRRIREGDRPLLWIQPGADPRVPALLAQAIAGRGLYVYEIPGDRLVDVEIALLAREIRAAIRAESLVPSALGGWSLGAITALALAPDQPLVLADALPSPELPDEASCEEAFARSAAASLGAEAPEGCSLLTLEALGAERLRSAYPLFRAGYLRSIRAVRCAELPIPSRASAVLAERGAAPHRRAWDEIGVSVAVVSGDHYSMWSADRGRETAAAIARALEETCGRRALR